ncbi:hypothetical protein BpHYR1_054046 [Brachionus plicatilis]|uniref:Uncharacterized protein n=1 Tax=Brachionus plicatilis TaxID=10195 RepID=A0A3M7R9N4_BRAPC|nr:hypothetical protein BpHYR1_054046 [Brachionus plicatilis]
MPKILLGRISNFNQIWRKQHLNLDRIKNQFSKNTRLENNNKKTLLILKKLKRIVFSLASLWVRVFSGKSPARNDE